MITVQPLPRIHPAMARSVNVKNGSDGPIYTWETADRHYTLTSTSFTKRELYAHEKHIRPLDGATVDVPWSTGRLLNERDALTFIAENTTIPVPRIIDFSDKDGVCSLTIETIDGEMLDGMKLSQTDHETMMRNMHHFVEEIVLPQLRTLKSARFGQISGLVLPPPRLRGFDERPIWASKTAKTERYVFCHCDLAQQNMIFNPKTLQIVGLINWEYAGYYPPDIEMPFWRITYAERISQAGLRDYGPVEKSLINSTEEADLESQRLIALIDETDPS